MRLVVRSVALIAGTAVILWGQASPSRSRLPQPTGPFQIGRVTVVYEDKTRIEPLDPKHNSRRLAVDIWYPAQSATEKTPAAYLDVKGIESAIGARALRGQLRAAYGAISGGSVITHATEGASFTTAIRRAPILIFSPGGGMIRELYTAQLENLASHGYVVAAITHSYDGFISLFPDGNFIAYDSKRWPAPLSFEGENNLNQLQWHTDDIIFVLEQLVHASANLPFAGRLDLARVGAFGHSFGGLAAGHACQKDRRFKACLNEDGASGWQPLSRDTGDWSMDQPFMLIERAARRQEPPDEELAKMNITRAQANTLMDGLLAHRDRFLRSTGKGAYLVSLQSAGTDHMDFSDLGLLSAVTPEERDIKEVVLKIVRNYTRAFFDGYLSGAPLTLLQAKRKPDDLVEAVEHFKPAKRPK